METLQYPDIQMDMHIIANRRLALLKEHRLAPVDDPGFTIQPFKCAWRGYLLKGGLILMYDPGAFNVEYCLPAINHPDPPYEVWVLEDDQVVLCYEVPEPDDPMPPPANA